MTPTEIESLRIAIAEECGFKHVTHIYKGKCRFFRDIPPYTEKLDAIQAAAAERFKTKEEQYLFQLWLSRNDRPALNWWQLTALEWSIAFARTAKIWRYKV